MLDWILRFFKGALIGTGFILPGVSGGALAAIFGLYQKIISFIAHITKDFFKNVLFFIPVGLGALFGMFLLARPLSYFLDNYEAYVIWGFIGCIAGTFPALWQEAGKEGRSAKHYVILIITAIAGFALLFAAKVFLQAQMPINFFTWLFAGFLIAIGILIPGMSPSNFLVYFGMYKPMVDGFKTMDLFVLLPLFFGFAVCLFSLSKLIDIVIKKYYAGLFHFVVGIVIASTFMIIPLNFNYLSYKTIIYFVTFAAGTALGLFMSRLEKKYKNSIETDNIETV